MFDTTHASHDDYPTSDSTCTAPPLTARPAPDAVARLFWDDATPEEQLACILDGTPPEWFWPERLGALVFYRDDPVAWGGIKATAKAAGVNVWDLAKAVDAVYRVRFPPPALPPLPQAAPTPAYRPCIVTMSDVQEQPVDWLWWPYLAKGEVAMLDGDPGTGKGLLTMQLAANLSQGWPLPDQQGHPTLPVGGPQQTLLLSAEDSVAATIKKRLRESGADDTKVHVLTGWLGPDNAEQAFTLQHIPALEAALTQFPSALVIIDPLQAYLGKIDMHRANETRPLMTALGKVAEKYHCAILCVRHPAKPGQSIGKAIHRGMGSVDFIGAARTGLFVEQHPVDPDKVFFCQIKSNIGPLGRTQTFTKKDGQFLWSDPSRLSAELIAGSSRGPDPRTFMEVVCWLEDHLRGGLPQRSEEIEAALKEEGYRGDTIKRAKKALGILSVRQTDRWYWHLPDLRLLLPPPLHPLHPLPLLHPLPPLEENQEVVTTCGEEQPLPLSDEHVEEEGQEDEEEQEDEVAGVPLGTFGVGSPQNGTTAQAPCFRCGSREVWIGVQGQAVCHTCHPQPALGAFGQRTQRALACARCQQVQMVATTGNGYLCTGCGAVYTPGGGSHGV